MSSYQELDDQKLSSALKQGYEYAFNEIYNRYWKTLLAIAYNHTRDKVIAEEIVQEVFISFWRRKDQLRVQSIEAYLATAVRMSVFQQYRKQKRRADILQLAGGNAHDICWDEEKVYAKFLREYINGIVETLPEKCRLVFKLSRVEELSISEIAEKMNIAEKTVESHLTKALKTIRLRLTHSGILLIIISKYLIK